MNPRDEEDLETWVAEVELAQQYIKKLANNEISVKEFDDQQVKTENIKQNKEKIKQMKQEEAIQKRKDGRSGKGEKNNYQSFCKNCFWEYELPTPNCLKCNKETINYDTRLAELKIKLEEYKQQKSKRQERKYKWDMWQKTQSMLWKKTNNNYSKWDVYTDSSEEEKETEPVVPKDDPNFKALEMDLQKRKLKQESDQKKADILKDDANKYMEKQQFHKAIELYSEAIDIKRDFKMCYTNRALAYIKVYQYELAIKDCTKLLDYCDCFEEGFVQSKNLTFKAFLRRALAKKHLKQYKDALLDIQQALILDSKDKQAEQLKIEIQQQIEIDDQIIQIKEKSNDIDTQIKDYLQKDLNKQTFVEFCVFLNSNPDNKTFFQKNYGVQKIIELLNQDKPCYLLLNIYLDQNPVFQEEFVKKKGVEILYKKAQDKLGNEDQGDIFENLTTLTLYDQTRTYMQNLKQSEIFIANLINSLLQDYENNTENLSSFFNMISNLSYGGMSKIKQFIINQIDKFINQMLVVIDSKKKRTKFMILKENIYNLTSNLLTDEETRKKLGQNKLFLQSLIYRLQRFDTQKDQKWVKTAESLLGVFVNLCHEQNPLIIQNLNSLQLFQKLQTFMFQSDLSLQNCKEVINRALNVLSKLEYNKDNIQIDFILKMIPYLEKQNIEKGYSNHVLRLIIRIFQNQEFTQLIQDQIKSEIYVQLVQYLCIFILQDDEMRFVNTCLLGGLIVQIIPDSSKGFKQIIPRLITIVRDNAGLKRKNSAIFLAKLSKDENNLEVIRQLHGIELLHNVSRFITQ